MKEAPRFLKEGDWLTLEIGLGQGKSITRQMKKKFIHVQHETDANGEIWVVIAQMRPPAIIS